jgi:hypothetical protein
MTPTSLEEAIQALREKLGPDGTIELKMQGRDDLIIYHHGLGRWIRNNWKLWADGPLMEHMRSLGFTHPDDVSSTIIKEFWLKLNGQPSELEKDAARYKEYWEKVAQEKDEQ